MMNRCSALVPLRHFSLTLAALTAGAHGLIIVPSWRLQKAQASG